MHIIATAQEFDAVKDYDGWPEGTTVVTTENSEFFFNYERVDGAWKATKDHKELDRDWKRGEKKKFLATLTRENVIEFYLRATHHAEEDNIPGRELDARAEYASDIFKHLPLHFLSVFYDDNGEYYVMPKFIVARGVDTDEVVAEVEEYLEFLRKIYPEEEVYGFDVLDHECSVFQQFRVYPDGKCDRVDDRYNRTEPTSFKNIREMVEFIKIHNYYG